MSKAAQPDYRTYARVDMFPGVSDCGLLKIAELARVRRLLPRTRVFSQGDGEVRGHVVLEGAINIVQSGSDGAQTVMRIAGPGQAFGIVAMFTDRRYLADAITMSETLEASWSEAEFHDLLGFHPEIAVNLVRVIGRGLQEMQERVRELATRSVEGRVASSILRLAEQTGNSTSAGTKLGIPLRRKDIADIAGTTLHTASRLLSAWEKAGLITNGKRILTLVRVPELRAIAEG